MTHNSICDKILAYSPDMICVISKDGHFVKISEACRHLLGYESTELETRKFTDFVHPEDIPKTLHTTQRILNGHDVFNFGNRYLHKQGHEVHLAWTARLIKEEGLMFCSARSAPEHHTVIERIAEQENFYQTLIKHSSDMLGLLDKDSNYLFLSDAIHKILGYKPTQLIGTNVFYLIHPDDLESVQVAWSQLGTSNYIRSPDFRYRAANGEWRWLEAIVCDQLQNPAIEAYVLSSRDITERKNARLKIEESEQRYRALFENNPDIVIFENPEGFITKVNQAFTEQFGLSPEQVTGKLASFFLPPEMAAVNAKSFQEALLGGTMRYDLEIKKGNRQFIFDTVKFPVTSGNTVIGVQTISKDITPLVRSFDTIEKQAKKLNVIFESITDAFFTLDKNWRYTFINSEFGRITGAREQDYIGRHLLELSEYGDTGVFYQQYRYAMETGNSVHFEAYSQKMNKWLEVKAYPSDEGLSVYFTDVTDKVKANQEVEKLSLVASKTDNGVIITDAAGIIEWVNEAFTAMSGYMLEEVAGKKPGSILQGPESDPDIIKEIGNNLRLGLHFSTQLINYRKSGEKFWLSMDITPIHDETGTITRYIAIQKDITYRKEVEASMLSLTQDLYIQNKNLQEFTYIVSHNLRAPVANALGLANLLNKIDKNSKTFDESLTHLKTSVLKMDTVLKDVNMILSVRDKQDVMEMEQVRLVDVFWQAYNYLQEPALLCGGEVQIDLPDHVRVNANKAYLFSIFYNLLSNAIKYRSYDRQLQIRVGCSHMPDGRVLISFSDNGTGFDAEKAGDDIFKLYKRFHKHKKGRGMGLFLVKAHIEAMGWKIEVNSRLNEGTTFLITTS